MPSDSQLLEPFSKVNGARRSFPARFSSVPETARFVEIFCTSHDVARDDRLRLTLIIEELVANTILHGHGAECDAPIAIALTVTAGTVTLWYEDTAPAFDFAAAIAKVADPMDLAFDDRPVGNLGLQLLSHYGETIAYTRLDARNQITLTLKRPP
jgi:serine/threonine-protein kinase RsbW